MKRRVAGPSAPIRNSSTTTGRRRAATSRRGNSRGYSRRNSVQRSDRFAKQGCRPPAIGPDGGCMTDDTDHERRRFLSAAAMTIASARLGLSGGPLRSAAAHAVATRTVRPVTSAPFAALKQIDAGVLNVGYAEAGPADGRAVILLHGWPYDIQSFADAAPMLSSAGYRVIVPYLRGYGTTRFLSEGTVRNGQQAVT